MSGLFAPFLDMSCYGVPIVRDVPCDRYLLETTILNFRSWLAWCRALVIAHGHCLCSRISSDCHIADWALAAVCRNRSTHGDSSDSFARRCLDSHYRNTYCAD